MNKNLYEEITSKLNALSDVEKTPSNIRLLMGQWSSRAYTVDMISVLCAFYNFMDGKTEYDFIHKIPDWTNFFASRFVNHFTIEVIQTDFDNIIFNDKIVDIILKFATEETQKEFYKYACEVNAIGRENGIDIYQEPLNKLESKLVEKGLIAKPIKEEKKEIQDENELISKSVGEENEVQDEKEIERAALASALISAIQNGPLNSKLPSGDVVTPMGMSAEEVKENVGLDNVVSQPNVSQKESLTASKLSAEKREIEEQLVSYRNKTFDSAAADLGLSSNDLIKMVGNEQSFEIDDINIDKETKQKITAKDEKIASLPNNIFKKVVTKINKRRKLRQMGLEVVSNNDVTKLNIVKKDTVFDKIATTSKNVVKNIKKGAEIAGTTALYGIIIGAIAVDEVAERVKSTYNSMSDRVSTVKTNLSSRAADGLRNVADRLSPQTENINSEEELVPIFNEEQVSSSIDVSGPNVILTAGTQVGTIPGLEQNKVVK